MIKLERLNSVSVMTSNVGSTHMTPREDYVRLSDARTYGDQRAAEAREQCAVLAWSHFMDACKKRNINPSTMPEFDGLAGKIRELK